MKVKKTRQNLRIYVEFYVKLMFWMYQSEAFSHGVNFALFIKYPLTFFLRIFCKLKKFSLPKKYIKRAAERMH